MIDYVKGLGVLKDLFGKDCTFVLATAQENVPSTRAVDTYYEDGVFWIVTSALSNKVREIESNPNAALCNDFYNFMGKAYNVGHPLKEENREIRETLTKVFENWYFTYNNEDDEKMCYVRFEPETGFFHKDGTGYEVNFLEKSANTFPFAPQIEM